MILCCLGNNIKKNVWTCPVQMHFFKKIFLICGWLTPQTRNPQIQRADCPDSSTSLLEVKRKNAIYFLGQGSIVFCYVQGSGGADSFQIGVTLQETVKEKWRSIHSKKPWKDAWDWKGGGCGMGTGVQGRVQWCE